jgi:hypothetical protein
VRQHCTQVSPTSHQASSRRASALHNEQADVKTVCRTLAVALALVKA